MGRPTRANPPRCRRIEHHAELPVVDLPTVTATVIVGAVMGVESPARRDTELVGVDLALRPGRAVIAVEPSFEHAIVVLTGTVAIDDRVVPADRRGIQRLAVGD
jgi:quercetin 2,3-dioxygenase